MDFKGRFGTDYLKTSKPSEELPPGMEDALIAYSRPVLEALKSSPGKTNQAFVLANQVNVRIDVLLRVVEYLIPKGYVAKLQEDKLGNDTLRLTAEGEKLLG